MNPVVTSKEAILQVCRKITAERGLTALSMRTVAAELGIGLGTLYNYFPDKDALLLATVESVWTDIVHGGQPCVPSLPFPEAVAQLFRCILDGAARYPHFLTTHALAIAKSKKTEAKGAMEQCFTHMKAGLLEALRSDPMVDKAAFSGDPTDADFVDFVLEHLLLLLSRDTPDSAPLLALIRRVIYR